MQRNKIAYYGNQNCVEGRPMKETSPDSLAETLQTWHGRELF
jgi:hypothetical protein